ncbi:universal stress protein [Acetobacter ghanensis]|uniref:Universal stress protein n=1 Tax=Acetobacter ghanensis TaxID=431306 RepID=A0A0U5F7A6_9PROT|nr:universal stress protein [Acetobacter ghanensis]NHO38763.1 universal stress protein [Acetobacter ghanensis]GBQ47600.1 universal stress protein [Acetobacter ghanensis DSM 18895]CEF57277.1 UspA domain-containing protein [Acetobacter ghanensis]
MRILAVLDQPDTAALTLDTARQLAERVAGTAICVLHPKLATNPDFQSPDEGLPDAAEQARFAQSVTARATALHQIFDNWRTTHSDIANAQWEEQAGDTRALVRLAAEKADLVVLDRPTTTTPKTTEQAFTAALYDAQATVVLAPLAAQATLGLHPVIAWQDTANLAHAIHSALPLLQKALHITFIIGESFPLTVPDPALVAELRAGGITVTVERFILTDEPVGEQIKAHALRAGADLLIMGAYGRPRFIEWLCHGPTVDILAHTSLPILTHH